MDDLDRLGTAVRDSMAPPPPLDELNRRARGRSRARATRFAVAAACVIAVVVGVLVTRDRDRSAAAALVVTPSSGLRSGDLVDYQIDGDLDPTDVGFVAQCPIEVVDLSYLDHVPDEQLLPRCTSILTDPGLTATVEVSAVIETPDGAVDCRASAGRCAIVARVPSGLEWSDLRFADDGMAGQLSIDSVVPVDGSGSRVAVSGSGVRAGEPIEIRQCRGPDPYEGCDTARNQTVIGRADGTFQAEMIVYQDVYSFNDDGTPGSSWGPCSPCVVTASRDAAQVEPVAAELPDGITRDRSRPTTTVLDVRRDGDAAVLQLRGAGYQPNQRPLIGLCQQPSATHQASCALPSFPSFAGGIVTDDDGRLDSHWYMPLRSFLTNGGDYCGTQDLPCVLGTQPGEGADLIAVAPAPEGLP